MYKIVLTKQAIKDETLIKKSGLKDKVSELLRKMEKDPYCTTPSYEKLRGQLEDYYSRRINLKHRLVYKVYEDEKVIKVYRMWTHYE